MSFNLNHNSGYSPTELMDAVKVEAPHKVTSIGRGLQALIKLANEDKIFKGDLDGIDALCYHLDGYTVQKAIDALQKVQLRF
jgi:hypothetical protein